MKKRIIFLQIFLGIILIVSAMFVSCDGNKAESEINGTISQEITSDVLPDENITEYTEPTVIVEGTECKSGDGSVEVRVEIRNNPGILGMDFEIGYDDSVMSLVDALSMIETESVNYTEPAYFRNPTTFLWDFENAGYEEDGCIIRLFFDIDSNAAPGDYPVTLVCGYGSICDENGEPIDVDIVNSGIVIK